MSTTSSSVSGNRPKATLFCPRCGREAALGEGEWTVSDDGGRRRYDCPACGATVTTRRSYSVPV